MHKKITPLILTLIVFLSCNTIHHQALAQTNNEFKVPEIVDIFPIDPPEIDDRNTSLLRNALPFDAPGLIVNCQRFSYFIGYFDNDLDGFADADGTTTAFGITYTIDFGPNAGGVITATTFTGVTFADGRSATGYFVDNFFEPQGCDPVPYTANVVTLTCPDGSPASISPIFGFTPPNIITTFGVNTAAFYPTLTISDVTPSVCPSSNDGSGAVPASIQILAPDGTVCETITGALPSCNEVGGNANTLIQRNPVNDELLLLVGFSGFDCTIDETADLSYDCPACCDAEGGVFGN